VATAPPAVAQECSADADCTLQDAICVDAVCQVQVGERVEVPPELGDEYVLETRRYWPLLIAGGALFGAAWIGTIAAVGATAEENKGSAIGQAFVPVAGPVILHSSQSAPADVGDLLIAASALQGLGLLTAFVGLTVETKLLVPAGQRTTGTVTVTPLVGGRVTGLGVGGTF
jgi:hypothetical protein